MTTIRNNPYGILGLAVTCLLLGCQDQDKQAGLTPKAQESSDTVVRYNISMTDIYNAKLIDSNIIQPLRISVQDSMIYVLDEGDFTAKKFNWEGDFIASWGKGKGKGPGELMKPIDMLISKDSTVWIADRSLRRVTQFDQKGKVLRTVRMKEQVTVYAFSADGGALVNLNTASPAYFNLYSLTGKSKEIKPEKSLGYWHKDVNTVTTAYAGDVIAHPEEDVFYYSTLSDGLIYGATFDGEEIFLRNVLSNVGMPPTVKDGNGNYVIDLDYVPKHNQVVINAWGEELFLSRISNDYEGEIVESFIDVYSVLDGSYLWSISVLTEHNEHICRPKFVTDKHILTECDDHISRYEYN